MNRGINDSKDLPREFLEGIYDEIASSEIRMRTGGAEARQSLRFMAGGEMRITICFVFPWVCLSHNLFCVLCYTCNCGLTTHSLYVKSYSRLADLMLKVICMRKLHGVKFLQIGLSANFLQLKSFSIGGSLVNVLCSWLPCSLMCSVLC